jgi:hypothetical protein
VAFPRILVLMKPGSADGATVKICMEMIGAGFTAAG